MAGRSQKAWASEAAFSDALTASRGVSVRVVSSPEVAVARSQFFSAARRVRFPRATESLTTTSRDSPAASLGSASSVRTTGLGQVRLRASIFMVTPFCSAGGTLRLASGGVER